MNVLAVKEYDVMVTSFDTTHRCDRCGAQARAQVILDSGYDLLMCNHDFQKNREALEAIAIMIQREDVKVS